MNYIGYVPKLTACTKNYSARNVNCHIFNADNKFGTQPVKNQKIMMCTKNYWR